MKVLVTGGSGFLGRNLIRALTKEKFEVISCSRTRSNEDVPQINCDINELSPWHLQDTKMVIHCAAKVGFSGRYSDFYKVNCLGTQNLISSCLKAGVKYFIYISSPSVVFDGHHIVGGDETLPYATKPKSFYAATKAIAERMILSEKNLNSVILRPHLIFGPDDTNLLPAIIKALKSGKLFRWCEEDYLADFTYIEDCVDAILKTIGYICNSTDLQYKVFFVSSGQPV
ncbi:MAG: NAD-dependent epimerase/dehydratase family protein, partial [Deltaproteobacteria bacterium]|nr:NAD-dependent epimerase/dehydratase family protein [Deltaproteobacteria bacterium]